MSEIKPSVSRRKIEELTQQAARSRRRYDRAKAEIGGPRNSDPERLRELKRESEIAQMRLLAAKRG